MKVQIDRRTLAKPSFETGELVEFTNAQGEQYVTIVTGEYDAHYKGTVVQSTMRSMPIGSTCNSFLKNGVTKFYGTLTFEVQCET